MKIEIVTSMGSDELISEAAGYSRDSGVGDVESRLRMMLKGGHTVPFELPCIILGIECPIDIWREFARYRVAAFVERSTRYVGEHQFDTDWLLPEDWELRDQIRLIYGELIGRGYPMDLARKALPLCTMTKAIWRMDAHCLMHILDQRLAKSAHKGAQLFALMLDKVFAQWLPLTHKIYHELRGKR